MTRLIYQEKIIFKNSKGKTLLRILKFMFTWWRTLPCQIAYAMSKNKQIVKSDFGNYGNFVKTLVFAKHNRNLFYHRMGRRSILYSWILPGDKTIKLPFSCKLGEHIHFVHNDNCYLNAERIGNNFVCYPHVVIGTKSLYHNEKPVIGNNVTIGTGSVIVGGINIGDNVSIGANSFVCQDIPNDSRVMCAPIVLIKNKL